MLYEPTYTTVSVSKRTTFKSIIAVLLPVKAVFAHWNLKFGASKIIEQSSGSVSSNRGSGLRKVLGHSVMMLKSGKAFSSSGWSA